MRYSYATWLLEAGAARSIPPAGKHLGHRLTLGV
jgi:hypothetical protein